VSEVATRPRLGFLGVGWIGRHRMEAIDGAGVADVAAVADPAVDIADVPNLQSFDALLGAGLDGIVIATPSALHADQAVAALEAGLAVFCQKPLGRTAQETARVVEAARAADRLLGVDLSYRFTEAAVAIRGRLGEIGAVHSADLVFHNAYGPDKAWFKDPALSGGGCVIDLGIHLVDLLLWTLGFPPVDVVDARLWGEPAEEFCLATLDAGDTRARLACSWFSHEGQDAVIEATFRGADGSLSLRNVGGSFYDFEAELRRGTARETLVTPPDEWGGRAAVDWARRLAAGERFDAEIERLVDVAAALDGIYGR
jgi:predicted dehydrogenase